MFLRDAQGIHRRNSDSFWVPPDEELLALINGDIVKVCNGEEQFWVQIVDVYRPRGCKAPNIRFTGTIDNRLVNPKAGQYGDLISFRGKHIYDIQGLIKKYRNFLNRFGTSKQILFNLYTY